jgi:hypothetical protein
MIVNDAPYYAIDIPLIWQYIGEIIGKNFPSITIFFLD